MPPAADLEQAAGFAYDNLFPKWATGPQFKAALANFVGALTTTDNVFPDETPNNRPIGNWFAVIMAFTVTLPSIGRPTLDALNEGAQYIYRVCWAAAQAETDGLITAGQAADMLAAYNVDIA